MTYQEPPKLLAFNKQEIYQPQPYILREDEKLPLFLIKLWNIVEDPNYYDVIRWDESGYSFHITDPYSFCRNVLPQFFKHNNLNSLIRQLNMYGFRKITPIERTSLARAESDQDHLEFSHPYFVREHPELLTNIKRKVKQTGSGGQNSHNVCGKTPNAGTGSAGTINVPTKDLSSVFEELRQLRERQKNMEYKMSELVKENEEVWQEISHMQDAHLKQQQIVNKLVQFLVSLVQPSKQQRLGKRHLLAIDEFHARRPKESENIDIANESTSRLLDDVANDSERFRDLANTDSNYQTSAGTKNANEMLDRIINEMTTSGAINMPALMIPQRILSDSNGPIIADVTDELDQLNSRNEQLQQQQQPIIRNRLNSNGSTLSRDAAFIDSIQQVSSGGANQISQRFVQRPEQSRSISYRRQQKPSNSAKNNRLTNSQFLKDTNEVSHAAELNMRANTHKNPKLLRLSTDAIASYENKHQLMNVPQERNQVLYHQSAPPLIQQHHQLQQPGHSNITESTLQNRCASVYALPQQVRTVQQQEGSVPNLRQSQQQQKHQILEQSLVSQLPANYSFSSRSPIVESPSALQQQKQQFVNNGDFNEQTSSTISKSYTSDQSGTAIVGADDSNTYTPSRMATTDVGGNDPQITFNDSPSDFNSYFNSVDQSINQCRENLANYWDLDDISLGEINELLMNEITSDNMQQDNNDVEHTGFYDSSPSFDVPTIQQQSQLSPPLNQLSQQPQQTNPLQLPQQQQQMRTPTQQQRDSVMVSPLTPTC